MDVLYRLARGLIKAALGLFIVGLTAWGLLALWFQMPTGAAIAIGASWCLLGAVTVARISSGMAIRGLSGAPAVFFLASIVMLVWWHSLVPSQNRAWADEVANVVESRIDGDKVTLRNVRNFEWKTETEYVARWDTRHYDLARLRSADLILSYWMGPHIAHTLISFGFDDGTMLVFSLEIRKERMETFSAIGGFFRKFEQAMVVADERDIIKTRSNARGEDVYLYRLNASPEQLRLLFREYLERAEQLRRAPEFYNTLTSNCTTIVFDLARRIAPGLPTDYRLLLSGHLDEYAYDRGALAPGHTFSELRSRGYINARARAAERADSRGFSESIRAGVPGVPIMGAQ